MAENPLKNSTLEIAKRLIGDKALRQDFMLGAAGKGNHRSDPLSSQHPHFRRRISDEEITDMYATNAYVQNIIDIPAEDMTKNGWEIVMKDEALKAKLMKKMRDLNLKWAFKKARSYERLHGDGFNSIGVTQTIPFTLDQQLDPRYLKSVDYVFPFSGMKVNQFILNDDMFDQNFGKVEFFDIYRQNVTGLNMPGIVQSRVHYSRLLHDQTRRLDDGYEYEYRGRSLIEPLFDALTVLDTSLWSVGQIIYDFAFNVYKSPGVDDLGQDEKDELKATMNFLFHTEALALIGSEDELAKVSTPVTGINFLLDYVWDYLCGAVKMPKSVIKGQEAGTITGAQYDIINYYSRISAMQENELRPMLEHLIKLIMMSEEFGHINPDNLDWKLKFNPLWQVDQKTDAEIRYQIAQADQIYMQNGVLDPEQVKETRFGEFGPTNGSKFNGDSLALDKLPKAELERIAKEVARAYSEARSHETNA